MTYRHCVDFTDYKELNLDIFHQKLHGDDPNIFAIVTQDQLWELRLELDRIIDHENKCIRQYVGGYPIIVIHKGELL